MSEGNGNGNGKSVNSQREKKIGGITGKGFMPGKSGNPTGKNQRRDYLAFGGWLRKWLLKNITIKETDKRTIKMRRVEWLVNKIADQRPDVLLHYAYGKPPETLSLADGDGNPVEFRLAVESRVLP